MTEVELAIREQLAPLLPMPKNATPDWLDVVRRARVQRARRLRTRLLVAAVCTSTAAAVLAATPLGASIARTLGDFSAWIAGTPGTPASPAEQQAFEEANQRSWAGFAADARLRRLLVTSAAGTDFTLYGFRSGDALCLRLVARGAVSATSTRCAPLHELQAAREPAVVVAADEPLGTGAAAPDDAGYTADAFSATFGIASDGVTQIVVHADDGTHDALVAGNSFLYLADHPEVGARVRGVDAVAADGARVALGFQSSPFGMLDLPPPPHGKPAGPSRVDRRVTGGSIGWISRLEPRGQPLPPGLRDRVAESVAHLQAMPNAPEPVGDVHPLIARLIQPDPNDPLRVALVAASPDDTMESAASRLCIFDVEGSSMSGTCLPFHDVFEQGPFTLGLQGSGPSQYSLLSGLASDDVAAMKVFLGSGATIDVALADNVYAARVARSEFPIRLAAYDSYGSVVGVHAYSDDGMISRAPAEARRSVRELMRVHGEGAGVAVVRAGIPAGGFRCWSIDFTGGAGGGGCTPWPYRGPVLGVAVTNAAGDAFLTGQASAKVASIEAELPDGGEVTIRPREGLVAYAVPAGQRFVALRALDADGNELATRGFRVTAPTRP